MNMQYAFLAVVYRNTGNPATQTHETAEVMATGSCEARARRRVLDNMHASRLCVRSLTLVAYRPATKGN